MLDRVVDLCYRCANTRVTTPAMSSMVHSTTADAVAIPAPLHPRITLWRIAVKKALRMIAISLTLAASLSSTTAFACSRFWINNYTCTASPGQVVGCTLIGYYEDGGCIYACPVC